MLSTGLKCPVCESIRDLAEAGKEPWPVCCFHAVLNLSNLFFEAVVSQTVYHSSCVDDSTFLKAVVDAAIVSPNPGVRMAAQKWRNERGEGENR